MLDSCDGDLHELDLNRRHECCVLAKVLIAQGKPDTALELLARLLQAAEAARAMSLVINIGPACPWR